MKITRLETIPLRVPLRTEFAIRSGRGGAHTVSPFLLVKVHTDEGLIGLGEASCTPRWSGEDQVTAAHLLHTYLEPLLVGEDPARVEALAAKFRFAFAANFFAKAAIEMALWDLAGKAAGKPVYELLGGKVRDAIRTKWSVSGVEPSRAAAIAAWALEQGFTAMKTKVGIEPDADVARFQAVREVVGADLELGVDANGGWNSEQAIHTVGRLKEHNLSFVEQPLPAEEVTELVELRPRLGVPVIADESVWGMQDARTLVALNAADVLSLYIGKAGGIMAAQRIADYARSAGLRCTLGSNLELGVGTAAMVHLAAATPNIAAEDFPCDIIGPFYYLDDIVQEPLRIGGGLARPDTRPGLGVDLDPEKIARYRAS